MPRPLKTPAIVTAKWLKQAIDNRPANFKILDCSWAFTKNGHKDYMKRHVPTAEWFDANRCVEPTHYIPRGLPSVDCFSRYARELGVNPDSHLVLYDQYQQMSASRTWWNFRAYGHQHISVLNGGLAEWKNDGFECEQGENLATAEGKFEGFVDEDLLCNYEKMIDQVRKNSAQILDGRLALNFKGEAKEPNGSTVNALQANNFDLPKMMAKGHLPRSINCQAAEFVDFKSRIYKSPEEIKQSFVKIGIDINKPLTILCYNGVLATMYAVAAASAGKDDCAVYYGSWTEFAQRAAEDKLVLTAGG